MKFHLSLTGAMTTGRRRRGKHWKQSFIASRYPQPFFGFNSKGSLTDTFSKHKSKKDKKSKDKKKKKKKHKRSSSSSSSDSSQKRRHKKDKHKRVKWVMPHLVVRVVSQKAHGGKLYNTKVQIQDVIDHENISVLTETNQLYEGLREKDLETVMPRMEENVRVVKGEHRGTTGRLMERNKKENKVRLMLNNSTFDIVEMSQDD